VPASKLLERLARQPPWMRDALCREPREAEFFPPERNPGEAAKDVCRRCVVTGECLAFALADVTLVGVWGGTTPGERRVLRTRLPLAG
jgi:WhiB family redox-sensing transcriptional regulator